MTRCCFCLALVLVTASHSLAQDRYLRYQLLEPSASSVGRALIMIHTGANPSAEEIPFSWTGYQLPGVISRSGLYVPPGQWSDWYALPRPPVWGTIDLQLRGDQPLSDVRVRIQIAGPYPDEEFLLRDMSLRGQQHGKVGFLLPDNLLETPQLIEPVEDGLRRRAAVIESVAPPEARRPRLITFSPCGVLADPTLPDLLSREAALVRKLGFNTVSVGLDLMDAPGLRDVLKTFPYRCLESTGDRPDHDRKTLDGYRAAFPEGQAPPIPYSMMFDEPAWYSGFNPVWKQSGVQGFHDFLKQQGRSPADFGVSQWSAVQHLRRDRPVTADAPLPQRRLWYWSNRYTDVACAAFFRQLTETTQQTFPDTLTTVNYSDHAVILFHGMIASGGPNWFEMGRANAVTMHWTEDWMFHGLTSWGNGLWQREGFLAQLLRAAGRYHQDATVSGIYIVPQGFAPLAEATDATIGVRVNLLLGRGVKHFGFFNYGPTARGTRDFFADNAPAIRGIGDALGMVGDPKVEPLVHAGQPAASPLCLLCSPVAEYWQALNNAHARNQEKQYAWMMLQQQGLTADILDELDVHRYLEGYRAGLLVDMNLHRAAAERLRQWVEAGGVLVLWPQAGSRDEFNDALAVFDSAGPAGRHQVGRGWIVRLDDMAGTSWWQKSKALAEAAGSFWASEFDQEIAGGMAATLKELGKVEPVVTVSVPSVVAEPLVSAGGIALLLSNLRGVQEQNATRYPQVTVTIPAAVVGGLALRQAHSSRHGKVALQRLGDGAVVVTLPLEVSDIVAITP